MFKVGQRVRWKRGTINENGVGDEYMFAKQLTILRYNHYINGSYGKEYIYTCEHTVKGYSNVIWEHNLTPLKTNKYG